MGVMDHLQAAAAAAAVTGQPALPRAHPQPPLPLPVEQEEGQHGGEVGG